MKNDVFLDVSGEVRYTGDIGHAVLGLTNGLKVARLAWRNQEKYLKEFGGVIHLYEYVVDSVWKPEPHDLLANDYAVDPAFLTPMKE